MITFYAETNRILQIALSALMLVSGTTAYLLTNRLTTIGGEGINLPRTRMLAFVSMIWNFGYGLLPFCTTVTAALVCKGIGQISLLLYAAIVPGFIIELLWDQETSKRYTPITRVLIVFSVVLWVFISDPSQTEFVSSVIGTSFLTNITVARAIHATYVSLAIASSILLGYRKLTDSTTVSEKRMARGILVSSLIFFPVVGVFDVVFPIIGIPALLISGIAPSALMIYINIFAERYHAYGVTDDNLGKIVYKACGTPMFVTRANGTIFKVSRSAEAFLTMNENELTGRIFEEIFIFDESTREEMRGDNNERSFNINARCMLNEKICSVSVSIVNDKYGDCLCRVMFVKDMTSEMLIMQQLEESKQDAIAASASKSAFLANMSHEIRTPINAILGMDEMILREAKDKTLKNYAANIQSAGRTLLALINDVLDFSRIESGKMEIISADYDTSSMINDLVSMTTIRANDKGLEFKLEVPQDFPAELYGDEVRIKQVITNLLTNAVKYTDTGSVTLSLGWRKVFEDEIELTCTVTDTGAGIKKEDLENLFSAFTRIDEKKNKNVEGTGLGLSITQQLVRLMNGKLDVESRYGQGSSFRVIVPQKRVGSEDIGSFEESYLRSGENRKRYREKFVAPDGKILVVDDNEMNLLVVKGLLKKTRLQIDTVLSGVEALVKVTRTRYNVILMDHMMPGLDGIETFRLMKEQDNNLSVGVPVIALTANAVSGAKERYIDEGFTDYLSKPIEGSKLEEMLIKYLPERLVKFVEDEEASEVIRPVISKKKEPKEKLIDDKVGLSYSGNDEENFATFKQLFKDMAQAKQASIEEAYANRMWEDYRIYVHALKSTSLNIGAVKLSESAKALEKAAIDGNLDYIGANHESVMRLYRRVVLEIGGDDEEESDSDEPGEDDWQEGRVETSRSGGTEIAVLDLLRSLEEKLHEFRLVDAEEVIGALGEKLTDPAPAWYGNIEQMIKDFRIDEAEKYVSAVITKLER